MRQKQKIQEYLQKYGQGSESLQSLILATITRTEGSAYQKKGTQKLIDLHRQTSVGILSGGCLEAQIIKDAQSFSSFPQEKVYDTGELEERFFGYQKGCQGQIYILFERIVDLSEKQLQSRLSFEQIDFFIIGANESARALGEIASTLGWKVFLLDHRKEALESWAQEPWLTQKIFTSQEYLVQNIKPTSQSVIVSVSHNYETDLQLVAQLKPYLQNIPYVGIIGSQRRFAQIQKDLVVIHDVALSEDEKTKIHSPAGLSGLGEAPELIALSVIAEAARSLQLAKKQLWGLVLAAGSSSRWGQPKQLINYQGEALLEQSIRKSQLICDKVFVALGAEQEGSRRICEKMQAEVIFIHDWKEGQGTTLAKSIKALTEKQDFAKVQGVCLMNCDQPLIPETHFQKLQEKWFKNPTEIIGTSWLGVEMASPVICPTGISAELLKLSGPQGAKSLFLRKTFQTVVCPEAQIDLDTAEDYKKLLQQ